jgi:hypothetical protein
MKKLSVAILITSLAACVTEADPQQPQEATRLPKSKPEGHVRALHIARGAPTLALTYGELEPMVDGIGFAGITADLPMITGDYAFQVWAGDTLMADSDTLTLDEGTKWSLVVWGNVDDMNASLLEDVDGVGYRLVEARPGFDMEVGDVFSDTNTITVEDRSFDLPAMEDRVMDLFVVEGEEEGTLTILACTSGGLVEIPANEDVPAARLRAVHLSPNAPNVDVFLNGAAAITDLAFANATGYAELDAGLFDVDVAPAAAGIGASVLSVGGLELLSAQSYSAVAFGALPNIKALALADDYSPVAPGKIRVRAAHTADGVGQVDILAVGATNSIIYDDVDFGSVASYIEIDAAAITLGLDLDDDLNPELTFDIPALPVGTVATIFAVLDDTGPFLFAVTEDASVAIRPTPIAPPPPPSANVRVVHLSPDAPAVAVNANGARIVETLEFFSTTNFVEVEAGVTDFDIALAASPDAPILSLTGADLQPDSFTTAVALGRASQLRVIAFNDDRSAPPAGQIRVRAIHAAVGIGNVDIYAGDAKLYDNVPFGVAGDALTVPAGQYLIGLDLNEDAHPDLTFQLPHLAEGTIANVYAVTDAHGNAHLAIQE